MNEKIRPVLIALLIISIPLVILLGSFRFNAFNMHFYEKSFTTYNPDVEDPVVITAQLLTFLKDKDSGAGYIAAFQEVEQEHLYEVRDVIHLFLTVLYIALAVMLISLVLLWFIDRKNSVVNLGVALFYGGVASALFTLVLVVLTLLNFQSAFVSFHKVFFTTVWQFPPDFLLIKLFPQIFFRSMLSKIIVGVFGASFFTGVIGFFLMKKENYLKYRKGKK